MDEKLLNNLKSETRWFRLLFMAMFAFVGNVVLMLIFLIAFVQAVHGFITGDANHRLLQLSTGLNQYLYQVTNYLTFNSEQKPYPFSDWPQTPTMKDVKNNIYDV